MSHPGRVLVVDDMPEWRERTAATLSELGYDVEVASGSREAGRLAAAEPFAFIVTDNAMETPDAGIGLLIGLQALGREVPAILYSSAFTEEQRAFLLRQLPRVQVVQKQPGIDDAALVAAVHALSLSVSTH